MTSDLSIHDSYLRIGVMVQDEGDMGRRQLQVVKRLVVNRRGVQLR